MKYPKPRLYEVKDKSKYIGNSEMVVTRSSLETRFMTWAERTPSVIKWASEELVVPYVSPLDNKVHRYFVDFAIVIQTGAGTKKYLVEIKPASQCVAPKRTKRMKEETYLNQVKTYLVNQAKWQAASNYAKQINAEFIVLTEEHLK